MSKVAKPRVKNTFCFQGGILSKPAVKIATVTVSTVRAPVFDRHQFFGTSEHYGKNHGSLLTLWMNYNYTACCWFPASSNILILPSLFWQIEFESYWFPCSKCRILVLLRYLVECFYYREWIALCSSLFYPWKACPYNAIRKPNVFLRLHIIDQEPQGR